MTPLQEEDLVHVYPLPNETKGGTSGVVISSSEGEGGTQYLIEFEGGEKSWHSEKLVELLQRDPSFKPTKAPTRSTFSQNPELSEAMLDAWYELSKTTFTEAFESLEGFGSAMLQWLKETNSELYHNIYLAGHKALGIKIYYAKDIK